MDTEKGLDQYKELSSNWKKKNEVLIYDNMDWKHCAYREISRLNKCLNSVIDSRECTKVEKSDDLINR